MFHVVYLIFKALGEHLETVQLQLIK